MEMMIVVARVLTSFDMRIVDARSEGVGEKRGEFQVKDCFNAMKDGPNVEFTRIKS
jgi:hypothetical protein